MEEEFPLKSDMYWLHNDKTRFCLALVIVQGMNYTERFWIVSF